MLKPGDWVQVVHNSEHPCPALKEWVGMIGQVQCTPQTAPPSAMAAARMAVLGRLGKEIAGMIVTRKFSDAVRVEFPKTERWFAVVFLRKVAPECDKKSAWQGDDVFLPAHIREWVVDEEVV